jgi:hypothetical protein
MSADSVAAMNSAGWCVEDVAGHLRIHAAGTRALQELVANLRHFLGLLLAHGAPQQVRLPEAETGENLGDLHHLFLVEHHPVGRREHGCGIPMGIHDMLAAVLAVDVLVDGAGLQWARSEQRDQRHDVVEPVRHEPADQVLHA